MSIPAGHVDGSMTHQILHRPQILAGHNQSTRKGVSRVMPGEVTYSSLPDGILEPVLVAAQEIMAAFIEEYEIARRHVRQQRLECRRCDAVQRDMTGLSVLRSWDRQHLVLEVYIGPLSAVLLASTHAGVESDFHFWQVERVFFLDRRDQARFLVMAVLQIGEACRQRIVLIEVTDSLIVLFPHSHQASW